MKLLKFFFSILTILMLASASYGAVNLTELEQATELYYSMDDDDISGSTILDLTPNNNDGTINGATTGVSGILNEAISLDGDDDYIDIPGLSSTSGVYLFSFWVENPTDSFLFDTTQNRRALRISSGNYQHYDGSTWKDTGVSVPSNQHHLVVAIEGNSIEFFIDKISVFTGTTNTWEIGSTTIIGATTGSGSNYYGGDIDEFLILDSWTSAGTAQEISEYYYNQGSPTSAQQYPYSSGTPTGNLFFQNITLNGAEFENNSFINTTELNFNTLLNSSNNNTNINQTYFLYSNETITETITDPRYIDSNNNSYRLESFDNTINQYCIERGYETSSSYEKYSGTNEFDSAGHNFEEWVLFFDRPENALVSEITCEGETISQQFATNNQNGSFSLNLSDGENKISFFAINDETNENTGNYTFTIDTTPPTISNNIPAEINSYFFNSSQFSCDDTNLADCYILINSQNLTPSENTTLTLNGNISYEIVAEDNAGNRVEEAGTLLVNPLQYFYFEDPSGTQLQNFSFGGVNFTDYASIPLYDYGIGEHTLEFVKYGYAKTNVTFNFTNTSQINQTNEVQFSLLYVDVKKVDGQNDLGQSVDLNLIGDNFAGEFSFTDSIEIDNITELPGTYLIELSSSGYEDISYYFQHTGFDVVNLTLYMEEANQTTPIKYIILDDFGNPIEEICDVKLSVYQITSNSYEGFIIEKTNSIGEVIFNIDSDKRYKASVTCNDRTQVYDGEKITSTPVYKRFTSQNLNEFTQYPNIQSDIEFVRVDNTTGRFKFTYNDNNNIISKGCLNISKSTFNSEGDVAYQCISSSSGSINIDFNVSQGMTYKAEGIVTYEGKELQVDSYFQVVRDELNLDIGEFGVVIGLIVFGVLAIGGFFLGGAIGVLFGGTIGLWIISLSMFGLWNAAATGSLTAWSMLLIVGAAFSGGRN